MSGTEKPVNSDKKEVKNAAPAPATVAGKESKAREYIWMLRPCKKYNVEYVDCKSLKDRFHQYWVEGSFRDCEQWKTDYDNCLKLEESKYEDTSALEALVESEKARIRTRIKNHLANDVWEHRDSPPEDWAKELPAHITQSYEGSFLKYKADEIRSGELSLDNPDEYKEFVFTGKRCTILWKGGQFIRWVLVRIYISISFFTLFSTKIEYKSNI